ncbi:hypothetical protein RF11_04499 [Thelohanellus kitauei]|uniref:Uncharacterized protein n=1 Tax=Thelohanellus kitauei TaxID=669202 RepID=A0A0C2J5V5_THEKT|nr:hypothetical protein RF11_04499 [Thelohanellus kitauei]
MAKTNKKQLALQPNYTCFDVTIFTNPGEKIKTQSHYVLDITTLLDFKPHLPPIRHTFRSLHECVGQIEKRHQPDTSLVFRLNHMTDANSDFQNTPYYKGTQI